MKHLQMTLLLLVALILPMSLNAQQKIVVEQEDTVVTEVTVDGVKYALDQRPTYLKSGEEIKLGVNCVTENVSFFTLKRICSWRTKIKATETGLLVLPGGGTEPRIDVRGAKILAIGLVIVSLFVLIPHKPMNHSVILFLLIVSVVFALGNAFFGSWAWGSLFVLNIIVLVGASMQIEEHDEDTPVWWRMAVVLVSVVIMICA
jgi:hypothetical protein